MDIKVEVDDQAFKQTVESSLDVLIFSIDTQYRYILFNRAFKEATYNAYGTTVRAGDNMLDSITVEEDRKKAQFNCEEAWRLGQCKTIEPYGDLKRSWFETRYTPTIDEVSRIVGLTIISTDVTKRIEEEQQLMTANEELKTFSFALSHDLMTPLRSIDGYIDVLLNDYASELGGIPQQYLKRISHSTKTIVDLINGLMAYISLGHNKIVETRVDANILVNRVIADLIDAEMKQRAKIDIHALTPAIGDESLLEHVWMNLISNALKFSAERSVPEIEIGCTEDRQEVSYFVKDNGIGFDMKYHDRLFEVLRRLQPEEKYKGAGIGLALVKQLVMRMGGTVRAESTPEKGACFYFTLHR